VSTAVPTRNLTVHVSQSGGGSGIGSDGQEVCHVYEVREPSNHLTRLKKPKAKRSPPFILGIGASGPSLVTEPSDQVIRYPPSSRIVTLTGCACIRIARVMRTAATATASMRPRTEIRKRGNRMSGVSGAVRSAQ
jgi:hypothetical protein